MTKLKLGEISYLADVICKYYPEEKHSYEIASHFSVDQRKKFLYHYYKKENDKVREMIDNIKALQAYI